MLVHAGACWRMMVHDGGGDGAIFVANQLGVQLFAEAPDQIEAGALGLAIGAMAGGTTRSP